MKYGTESKRLLGRRMLTPEQIRRKALRGYEGLLRSMCGGEAVMPLVLLGGGMRKSDTFAGDTRAIAALREHSKETRGFGYEITWEERRFRRIGLQRVPAQVSFPTERDLVSYLGKGPEVDQFRRDIQQILHTFPELTEWARRKPLTVVEFASSWDGLLKVCLYLREHPRPSCYLREVPVVHTKFIERHKGILGELLPIAAPACVTNDDTRFETRYGFRWKQPTVRIRRLDPEVGREQFGLIRDFAIPHDELRQLPVPDCIVLVVENEMTFLTLPTLPGTLAFFGAGDAAALLTSIDWLGACRILYWGDIDTHGLETLAHLRRRFPGVQSVLMDTGTLEAQRAFVERGKPGPPQSELVLDPHEEALYRQLLATEDLLEQERIPPDYSTPLLLRAVRARVEQDVKAGSGL